MSDLVYTLHLVEQDWEDLTQSEYILYATQDFNEFLDILKHNMIQYPQLQAVVWKEGNPNVTCNFYDFRKMFIDREVQEKIEIIDSIFIMDKLTN